MPYLAILEADLIGMMRSWVIRIWLVLMAFQAFFTTASTLAQGEAAESVSGLESISGLLATFPLLWSTFVIIISSGAVSSEAGVVADSILSKAVTRYEYILAKMSARLITVLGLYLISVIPPAYIIARNTENDMTTRGIVWAILIIGMILVLLTSLAVTFSTLFNRTLVTVVVVWMLWYGAGLIFAAIGIEYLSPLHIIDNLPFILQGDYTRSDPLRIVVGFSVASLTAIGAAVWYFSRKDL